MTGPELSVAFFLQMFIILAVCRAVGALARLIHQPQVIGEMIAGVLLGPSLFGLLAPEWQAKVFRPESLKVLYVAAQVGVGLYMFLVGVEFDRHLLRSHVRSAVAVSISGMLAPFALGGLLALWLIKVPGLFSEQTTQFGAILFLGAAMSITAFPTLARIIYERGLTGTSLGTLVLTAGAFDDMAAWCVLAVVLGGLDGGAAVALKAIGGGIAFGVLALTAGRHLLARLGPMADRAGKITPAMLAVVLACFAASAWFTDAIGIHAVFGGFILGVAMPRGLFARELTRHLEAFTVVFLLPIFFTYSGLNTRLDLVNNWEMLMYALVVLAAAMLGKFGACWAAARLNGENQRTALAVGTLMNARGMMGLIILNIGLQRGVIKPALFSVMVVMSIVTTLMASPLFEWVYGRHARQSGELGAAHADE